ncbi:MAG: hypothetical protein IPJ41_01760 [Phycisphaerales bacterium]|nr:hypothetical protein [Phycisphaerales bacterium]
MVTSICHATIFITDQNGDAVDSSHYSISNTGNDYEIAILSHHAGFHNTSVFVVHGTAGENIVSLTIDVDSDDYANSFVIVIVESLDGTDGFNNLVEVAQTGTEETVLSSVDVNGYIGSISVDAMGNIDAVGNIDGPVVATGMHSDAVSPTITTLRCTTDGTGNILGNVTSAGRIGWITAENGNVGLDSANRVTIQCEYSDGWIQGENVYADISAATNIARVKATAGEFVGSLSAQNIYISGTHGIVSAVTGINATIDLADDLLEYLKVTSGDFEATSSLSCDSIDEDGLINFSGDFAGDAIVRESIEPGNANTQVTVGGTLSGSITVGDNLNEDIAISDGAGLTGQIIINSNNDSGVWEEDATVTVGSTTLTWNEDDEYPETAASLGGGAVGLVPFSTHRESCSPVYGADRELPPPSRSSSTGLSSRTRSAPTCRSRSTAATITPGPTRSTSRATTPSRCGPAGTIARSRSSLGRPSSDPSTATGSCPSPPARGRARPSCSATTSSPRAMCR